LGEGQKEERTKLSNKKITLHHRADYFIQNLIFHYFIKKMRGCVTEREREREREKGRGHPFVANGIRYTIFL
jgi:hypothetical protein